MNVYSEWMGKLGNSFRLFSLSYCFFLIGCWWISYRWSLHLNLFLLESLKLFSIWLSWMRDNNLSWNSSFLHLSWHSYGTKRKQQTI
jgi:hypothetical protein